MMSDKTSDPDAFKVLFCRLYVGEKNKNTRASNNMHTKKGRNNGFVSLEC